MKNLSGRRRLLFAASILIAMALLFQYYDKTRGRLAPRSREERLQQVNTLAQGLRSGGLESRQILTAAREFFLDYPDSQDQKLRLSIAFAAAEQPDADWMFVTDTIEAAALHVLAGVKGVPKQQDFEKAGFIFESSYVWPTPFLVTDIDGDGSPDVLLAAPSIRPGVCYLFRHTKQGWISTQLGVGVPIMGLWAFDITPHGPKAIAIACLADSEYDPNLLFDVFAWQQGRLNNVLSTTIHHGWQWEHKDRESNGVQSLRLVEHSVGLRRRRGAISHTDVFYRWDGSRFVLQPGATHSPAKTSFQEGLQKGEALYEAGRYQEAETTLERSLQLKPDPNDDETWERARGYYVIGLCRALLGDGVGARQAMSKANVAKAETPTRTLAQRFLDATAQPGTLPEGLAAVGQVFPLLAVSARHAAPGASPKTLLAEAHLRTDLYREAPLSGPGAGDVLTQFSWSTGNAVVAWRRDPQTQQWVAWPVAYGLIGNKPTSEELYQLPAALWFCLPHASALQATPTPDRVQLVVVTSDSLPQIEISYQRGRDTQNGAVAWNGEEFVMTRPSPMAAENLEAELSGIEARLFARKDYRMALTQLDTLDARIGVSARSFQDKTDLRLELYYHQALCYRKLGDTRHAEVILSALQRAYPDTGWGRLATAWLNGSGLPHDNLHLPDNLQPQY